MTTERWYFIRAYNAPIIHAWGTETDCDAYVDHLNKRRTVNLYAAIAVDEDEARELDARAMRYDDAVDLRDEMDHLRHPAASPS
jgi:hypothetical protein